MSVTGQQLQALARQRGQSARAELQELDAEGVRARRERKRLDDAYEKAWADLATSAVPSLSPPLLDERAARFRMPSLAWPSVQAQIAAYTDKQQQAIAAVDVDPAYLRREDIENTIAIQLAELADAVAPLLESVSALEAEPYFAELVRVGYDSDGYSGRFWQLSYYRHWQHADLVVAKHAARMRATRFCEIAAKYRAEQDALRPLLDDKRTHDNRRAALQRLVDKRATAERNLAGLDERMLKAVQGSLQTHLRALALDDVKDLVAGDAVLETALKRVVGVDKQRSYLAAMEQQFLQAHRPALEQLVSKAARADAKYSRPKNWSRRFDVDPNRAFPDKSAAWLKRRQRFSAGSTRLLGFNEWDRANLSSNFLWWDLFFDGGFDGGLDGDFVPEVRELRHSGRAMAAVARQNRRSDEGLDDVGAFDAS